MAKMKDSGIEWIGEIPEDWKITKYKNFANSRMGETILASETKEMGIPIYSATQEDKIFGYVDKANVELHKGDFVIPARGNSIGCVTIVNDEVATCTQTTICSRNIHGIETKFLFYCCVGLKTEWFKYEGSAIPQITVEQVNNNLLPLPPSSIQKKIVEFLDNKTGKIDTIIAKTKATIEDYKKYRQTIITEAVTIGIQKDTLLKNSNVTELGDVRKDAEVIKFKYIGSVMANLVDVTDYLDYPQVSPDKIEKGSGKLISICTVKEAGVISDNHLFYKNMIVYSKVRPLLNKAIIAEFDGLCSADMYPIESRINTKYLLYYILSNAFLAQISSSDNRVKMPKLNKEELAEIRVVVPNDNEQKVIAAYLDSKCAEIDKLIASKEALVEELEAYKKSVIYEYVTGKKEVD